MARRVTIAVLLIASIIFNMCASADVRRVRVVDWEENFVFAAEDVNVWLADDEGIWLSYKRTMPKFVVELSGVTALDAYDDGVYALREDEGDDIVSFIEPENGVAREWLLPDLGGYCGIAALQDKIALLAGKQDECTLVFLDKANGTVQEVEGAENLAYISRRDETRVFASSLTEGKIISVDTDGTSNVVFAGDFYAQSVYEKEDGTILLFGQNSGTYMLMRLMPSGELRELGVLDIPGMIYGSKLIGDKLYINANNILQQIEIDDFMVAMEEYAKELTIASHDILSSGELNIAVRAFKAQNPGVNVRFLRASKEDLALMLMAGASEYDLLYLSWQNADEIIRTGIADDLSMYPALMEQKQNWIDIGAMYDTQGRWLRVPVDLMPYPEILVRIDENQETFEHAGIELTGTGIDYSAFTDLCQRARTEDKALLGMINAMNPVFFLYSTMCGNSVDEGVMRFDTPEFRQMMEFWKELYDDELIFFAADGETIDTDRVMIGLPGNPYEGNFPSSFRSVLNGDYLYLPTENGEMICPIEVSSALYLNRYGVRKDLAVEFIAAYMSPEVQADIVYDPASWNLFLLDINSYPQYEALWLNKYGFADGIADYSNYIQVLENTRYYGWILEMRGPFLSMAQEYFAGELELEDFVAEMEKLADIWMNE